MLEEYLATSAPHVLFEDRSDGISTEEHKREGLEIAFDCEHGKAMAPSPRSSWIATKDSEVALQGQTYRSASGDMTAHMGEKKVNTYMNENR